MKYGILFGTVCVLLIFAAITHRGYVLCLWPAVSFGVVSVGYLFLGPRVYGKSDTGVLSRSNTLILLPYLMYLWTVWYLVRLVKTESAYDQLTNDIYIGRRLLAHEVPTSIDHVIDLTCEFTEPKPLRDANYHSFQILDGFVPETQQLQQWVDHSATLKGTIYIHCAEGHGRTGLFAAALLVHRGDFTTVDDGLDFVKSKRPLVRLGSRQLKTLAATQTP